MAKVKVDALASAIEMEMKLYDQTVTDEIKKTAQEVASDCAKEIQQAARTSFKGRGKYAKGWTAKTMYESKNDIRIVVYNSKEPQITHLLEYGHAKVNGGRVQGHPHIRPAAQEAEKEMMQKAKVAIKG